MKHYLKSITILILYSILFVKCQNCNSISVKGLVKTKKESSLKNQLDNLKLKDFPKYRVDTLVWQEIHTGYFQAVLKIEESKKSEVNPSISDIETWILKLITTDGVIIYNSLWSFEGCLFDGIVLDSIDVISDTEYMGRLSKEYLKSAEKELDLADLFDLDVGFSFEKGRCSAGAHTGERYKVESVLSDSDFKTVHKWLTSPKLEYNLYGYECILRKQEFGERFQTSRLMIENKKGLVRVCSADMIWLEPIENILERLKKAHNKNPNNHAFSW